MEALDVFLILLIHVLCFVSGLALSDRYHREAKYEMKRALEQQYQRLMAGRDADDPCKPYVSPGPEMMEDDLEPTDPIPREFMERMQENGSATMML